MKKLSLRILQTILTVGLLFYFALPQNSANALIGDVLKGGTSFTGCVVAGKASPFLSEKINDGIKKLRGLASKIPKIGKFISGGSSGSASEGKVPVDDQDAQDLFKSKEYSQDTETRCAAIEILNYLNININGLVRSSGRDGGPIFIRNWRNFQTESQYRGEGIFRAVLSNTTLCDYIDKDIKSLFGITKKIPLDKSIKTRTGNADPYALRANCTMPSNFNLTNFQKDFSGNGGWQAFSRMLEPQNNYYGTLFGALGESAKQRALEESSDLNQALANKGLLGKSGKDANDSCLQTDDTGKCLAYKNIQTPGTVIAESIAASINSELNIIVSADEVNELISTAVFVLLNRLNNLSDPNEGDYISPNVDLFDPNNFTTLPPGGNGGGVCSDDGTGSPVYESDLNTAIDAVITANPDGIADELNTDHNGFVFLSYLGPELERMGFNATATVLNGNGNPNQGDLIALQRPFDPKWERYDVIVNSGAGDEPLRNVVGTDYVGTIPLSCVTGGGGGGGENPPPEQEF